jgi:hypothetical protein
MGPSGFVDSTMSSLKGAEGLGELAIRVRGSVPTGLVRRCVAENWRGGSLEGVSRGDQGSPSFGGYEND